MSELYENNQSNYDVVSGVETVTKRKKGPIIAAVTAGVLAVGAGGTLIAYNTSDFVKNKIKLATLSPEKYYAWVNEENSKEATRKFADSYKELADLMSGNSKDDTSSDFKISYSATDEVKSELLTTIFGTGYEEYEDNDTKEFIDVINNINKITLGSNSASKGNNGSGSVFAAVNDETLISLEYALDFEGFSCFFRIPQLTEKYLGINFNEILEEEISDNEAYEKFNNYLKDPESLISASELEELLNKYSNIWYTTIDDVELEKKEDVDIGDITVKYTTLTVDLDSDLVYDLSKNYLKEISKDKTIKKIVIDKLEICTEEEFDNAINDALDELKESKENADDDSITGKIVTYVDPKGHIRGCSFNTDSDYENFSYEYIIGKEDDNICGIASISSDGDNIFNGEFSAVESKNETYSGEFEVSFNTGSYDDEDESVTLSVEFDKFKVVNKEKAYFDGEFTFVIPEVEPFSLTLSSDGKSQKINFDLNINDVNYGEIEIEYSSDKSGDVSIPSTDDAYMIDNESDFNIEDYVTQDEFTNFVDSIFTNLGFGKDISETIAEMISDELFNASDDYYYDDYDYDYDDDYDWEDYDWDEEDYEDWYDEDYDFDDEMNWN